MRQGIVKHHWIDSGDADATARRLDAAGADVYFALADFTRQRRTQENVAALRWLWADVDCGPGKPYTDWRAGLAAVVEWTERQRVLPPTHIVRSGTGLHVYWGLSESVPLDKWLPVAQRLKQACLATGLHIDPARTADAASALRVPGTRNHKSDPPLPVALLAESDQRHVLADFARSLPLVGPRPLPSRHEAFRPPDGEFPPADASRIAERCAQMAFVRDRGGAVSEPLWRAALSVLHRCEGGETLIHEWSKGDPRYDPDETEAKARGTAGPMLCERFAEAGDPTRCLRCPHHGKVASPIVLGTEAPPPPVREGDVEAEERINAVGMFRVTSRGVFADLPDEETGATRSIRVSMVPIWVVGVFEQARTDDDRGATQLLVQWHGLTGESRRGYMDAREATDRKLLGDWLADHALRPLIMDQAMLTRYLSEITVEKLKQGSRTFYAALGWYGREFVLGDRIVGVDGVRPAKIRARSPLAAFRAREDACLDGWIAGANAMGDPRMRPHAAALLAGFGGAIAYAVAPNANGVPVASLSLTGESRYGKTLAGRMAASIYGEADKLRVIGSSTRFAVMQTLGRIRHGVMLYDEVTVIAKDAGRLRDFLLEAANGATTSRGTREGGLVDPLYFRAVPIITSNRALTDMPQRDMPQQARYRLLELPFRTWIPLDDYAAAGEAVDYHYGTAAVPYLQAVARVWDSIPTLYARARTQAIGEAHCLARGEFAANLIACAMVGGSIARAVGLISWDVWPVIRHMIIAAENGMGGVLPDTERFLPAVSEYVTFFRDRICHWPSRGRNLALYTPREPVGRYDKDTDKLHLAVGPLGDYLADQDISRSNLTGWYRHIGARHGHSRLAPGTPSVRVLVLPCRANGLDMGELEGETTNEEDC